jgi:hypothetical protein
MSEETHEEDVELERWLKSELEKPAKTSPLKCIQQIEVRFTLSDRAKKFDLNEIEIRLAIESLLKGVGMKIVSRDTDHEIEDWGHARFLIWICLIPNNDRSSAYISVDVQDSAKLTRNQASVYASIWNAEVLFSYTDPAEMRDDIRQKVISFAEEFISDYLSANPPEDE